MKSATKSKNKKLLCKATKHEQISFKNSEDMKNWYKNEYDRTIEDHTSFVIKVAITHDSKYAVSGSNDKTVRIWNLQNKRQEGVLEGYIAQSYQSQLLITTNT